MKKLIAMIASVVAVFAIALVPLTPVTVSAVGTEAQRAVCEAEEGAVWDETKDPPCTRPAGEKSMNEMIQTIINVMLFIVGILSVVMIIFGGIRYVSSAGNKSAVDSAKNTIVYAVVGLIVAILAFALVQWMFSSIK